MNSRWTCGPLATSNEFSLGSSWDCDVYFDLVHFRYVRQIQFGETLSSPNLEFRVDRVVQRLASVVLYAQVRHERLV